MKLEDISGIENLEFDIANRKLTVFHYDDIDQIEKSIIELNLGGIKISSEQTQQIEFNKDTNQKKLLWSVFVINFAFFNSTSNEFRILSVASLLKKTVIGIFSLKSSDIFFELITNNPKVPNRNNTKKILKTTEK